MEKSLGRTEKVRAVQSLASTKIFIDSQHFSTWILFRHFFLQFYSEASIGVLHVYIITLYLN